LAGFQSEDWRIFSRKIGWILIGRLADFQSEDWLDFDWKIGGFSVGKLAKKESPISPANLTEQMGLPTPFGHKLLYSYLKANCSVLLHSRS